MELHQRSCSSQNTLIYIYTFIGILADQEGILLLLEFLQLVLTKLTYLLHIIYILKSIFCLLLSDFLTIVFLIELLKVRVNRFQLLHRCQLWIVLLFFYFVANWILFALRSQLQLNDIFIIIIDYLRFMMDFMRGSRMEVVLKRDPMFEKTHRRLSGQQDQQS
jgi:hypothetical protein